ncbi:MAG: tRNA (adenosine(37)-N6)-dimethylallyltransferase MiaA [Bacteroidetes bacterium]|nr:tRNA (adenosine(37)-N6)-dimethylallyltransferase MiaA [Bacteroidota bacterium]
MKNYDKLLIVILGPTAVGKTSVSIELAKLLKTEIISADSRQFYKEMKIGTAPPNPYELNEVKHNFIGHLSVKENYDVSKYETDAIFKINNLFEKYSSLIMVGGSGLYINAVLNGIDDLPDPDESTRDYLKTLYDSEGIASLRKLLKDLDPEFYSQVDLMNHLRIIRALEVCLTTGQKFSSLRKNVGKKRIFENLIIGLNRDKEELYYLINKRVDIMMENGFLQEARELYPFRNFNALKTVGYKELFDYIDGLISLDQAVEKIKTNSRHYAKRQLTWFRKTPGIKWFNPSEINLIYEYIENIQRIEIIK